jgi:hypothetical protein
LDARAYPVRCDQAVISGIAVRCPAMVCLQTMRGDLQDATKAL